MPEAKVVVQAGICGFVTAVSAVPDEFGMVRIALQSDCPNMGKLAAELDAVDPMDIMASKAKDGVVYAAAARALPHHACPVPVGIIKAVEVAGGFALPADVSIEVKKVEN